VDVDTFERSSCGPLGSGDHRNALPTVPALSHASPRWPYGSAALQLLIVWRGRCRYVGDTAVSTGYGGKFKISQDNLEFGYRGQNTSICCYSSNYTPLRASNRPPATTANALPSKQLSLFLGTMTTPSASSSRQLHAQIALHPDPTTVDEGVLCVGDILGSQQCSPREGEMISSPGTAQSHTACSPTCETLPPCRRRTARTRT